MIFPFNIIISYNEYIVNCFDMIMTNFIQFLSHLTRVMTNFVPSLSHLTGVMTNFVPSLSHLTDVMTNFVQFLSPVCHILYMLWQILSYFLDFYTFFMHKMHILAFCPIFVTFFVTWDKFCHFFDTSETQ